jgi:hypothetical protein
MYLFAGQIERDFVLRKYKLQFDTKRDIFQSWHCNIYILS